MTLTRLLDDFACSIALATSNPPDEYPEWSHWTYETHMADLRELWTAIRPKLKNSHEAESINTHLEEMLKAFDVGDKEKGRSIACTLYNFDVKKLR